MSNCNKVIWTEGMFLRHEHFQQQERYFESVVNISKTVENGPFLYGFTSLELEAELLKLGKIRLSKFSGTFPDGTSFQNHLNCSKLDVLEIKKNVSNCIVYLALPLHNSSQVAIDSADAPVFLARYRVENAEIFDTNMYTHEAYNINLGRLYTRLLLETQDRSQYTCLAVAKIKEVSLNGEVILDKNFIPLCINAKISHVINQFLEKLHTSIANRCDDLSSRLNRPERYEATYMADFILLQVLCRYRSLSLYWHQADYLNPEVLYIELLKLGGELAAFTHRIAELKNFPPYQHQDLFASFSFIMEFILDNLLSILNQRAIQLELIEQEQGRYIAKIGDWIHLKSTEIILAIKADTSPDYFQTAFVNQIKVASTEVIEQLISLHLPGIHGAFLSVTPPELPFHSGYMYFKLDKSDELYKQLSSSIGLAIHIGGYFPSLDLKVWIIKN